VLGCGRLEPQPSFDPYRAPRAALESTAPDAASPASRGKRLGGAIVDLVLRLLPNYLLDLGGVAGPARGGNIVDLYLHGGLWANLAGAAVATLTVVQWYLITQRGQSLGKMVVRSRIVRMDGAAVGFLHGVVIRNWALWLLEVPNVVLPLLGVPSTVMMRKICFALALIDFLFIFGRDGRCLHDRLAGTKVVDGALPNAP
jgi:uncharacterized RDD family membrane protein YckC